MGGLVKSFFRKPKAPQPSGRSRSELEEEKKQAIGSNRKKIRRKIKSKEEEINSKKEEITRLERPRELLKSEKIVLLKANQQKQKICPELRTFSSLFSPFLLQMRN